MNIRRKSSDGTCIAGGIDGTSLSLSCRSNKNSGGFASNTSSKLFQPGTKILVHRAPILNGLSIPARLQKKFQRPMLKRRAYNRNADDALRRSSLGQRKRMDGMTKLMARAGRGLTFKLPQKQRDGNESDRDSDEEDDNDDEGKENDRPFEPLRVWQSPHNGGEPKGLPARIVTETRPDEYGIDEEVKVKRPAPDHLYSKNDVLVPPVLAKWLRPHQREGVQFMYDCVMGLKDFDGKGCILADDMGLGKTLQSVTLIYTLLKTSITANGIPSAKRVIVVCPCSLVKNWENEFVKWLGPGAVKTLAIAEADRSTVEKNLDAFVRTKIFNVLIASYECIRGHVGRLTKHQDCCDLLVCDEAHRLKNNENQTSKALDSLPVKRRVLLTGTPMQNDLQEFYAMVNFTNPGVLGTQEEFRKNMLFPILRGREPDATEAQKRKMMEIQNDMSTTVNDFILRRVNTLNAQHLPPKLVQVVCCNLTEIQQNMYQHLITSKDMQHVLDGKQVNCLGSIQMLMKLCNHPSLIAEEDEEGPGRKPGGRRAASKKIKYSDEEKETAAAPGAAGVSKFLPYVESGGRSMNTPVHPEWSGKMFVLYRLMKEMRRPGNGSDKIVIISNYTQTLDLIGRMCRENSWGFCRLDGSVTMKKRQKMVDEFNDPSSSLVAFLLSSKAGGCGLNLIGGNRLVLFDPDWNPAVDKQAAARCWRDGQKKRCFTYRFMATGTVEEKIFQRQLSKEGLQSVVDDKEQVNALSTKDLRNLFKLRTGTPSDTHDKLRCERCQIIHDNAELEAQKLLPTKLARCKDLLDEMAKEEDAAHFLKPMNPQDHDVSPEEYEKIVKQPMDLGTIRTKLEQALASDEPMSKGEAAEATIKSKQAAGSGYKSISEFSKDVNRIFANCLKVWTPEKDEVADAARRLQGWWVGQWSTLVPELMNMKPKDNDKQLKKENDVEDELTKSAAALCNERGDNYQEQLGMPDEENMRSWSHHYSTDTVDDPIFRAALRGYDTVSFVFGLEVTWSLIQQRQQEEEERQAMMELQAIQELGGPRQEEAKDGEDNSDKSVESSGSAATEAVNDDGHSDGKTDQSSSEEDEVEDIEQNKIEGTPTVDSYVANSEMTPASNGVQAQVFDGSSQYSDAGVTAEVVADTQSTEIETPAMDKENHELSSQFLEEGLKDDQWSCGRCTFINDKSTRKCETCGMSKPRTTVGRKKRRLESSN